MTPRVCLCAIAVIAVSTLVACFKPEHSNVYVGSAVQRLIVPSVMDEGALIKEQGVGSRPTSDATKDADKDDGSVLTEEDSRNQKAEETSSDTAKGAAKSLAVLDSATQQDKTDVEYGAKGGEAALAASPTFEGKPSQSNGDVSATSKVGGPLDGQSVLVSFPGKSTADVTPRDSAHVSSSEPSVFVRARAETHSTAGVSSQGEVPVGAGSQSVFESALQASRADVGAISNPTASNLDQRSALETKAEFGAGKTVGVTDGYNADEAEQDYPCAGRWYFNCDGYSICSAASISWGCKVEQCEWQLNPFTGWCGR